MKKLIAITVAVVLLLTLGSGVAVAASPKGAVKLALHERTGVEGWNDQGSGPQVGWAIANTSADGRLIVQIHLDNDKPSMTFSVFVKINEAWRPADVGELTTNRKGKGNAHAELDIGLYPPSTDTIDVQVVVREDPAVYPFGYATATAPVPLKK